MSDIGIKTDGSVGIMRIERPDSMNAFTHEMLESLLEALRDFEDDDGVRAVLFTAAGNQAFCVGADLGSDYASGSSGVSLDVVTRAQRLLRGLRRTELPVVGGISGHAVGAGMDLALGCDIRVVRADAILSQAYVDVGLVPGDGGAYLLPRLVGEETAKDLIFSGRQLSGEEAYDLGLATAVVNDDAAATREAALERAREYAEGPTVAIGKAKRLINESHDITLDTALAHAIEALADCRETDDHLEAVAAFQENREPQFTGE